MNKLWRAKRKSKSQISFFSFDLDAKATMFIKYKLHVF